MQAKVLILKPAKLVATWQDYLSMKCQRIQHLSWVNSFKAKRPARTYIFNKVVTVNKADFVNVSNSGRKGSANRTANIIMLLCISKVQLDLELCIQFLSL